MGGVLELADAPRSGRPRQADAAYLHALEAAVSADPGALGQACDVWTSARLSAYSAKTAGTRIAPGWVRVLKRDHYSHLAPTLRSFVDELPAGPRRLGAVRCGATSSMKCRTGGLPGTAGSRWAGQRDIRTAPSIRPRTSPT